MNPGVFLGVVSTSGPDQSHSWMMHETLQVLFQMLTLQGRFGGKQNSR